LAIPNFSAKNRCGVKLVSVISSIPLKAQTCDCLHRRTMPQAAA
jgi:hypothetical protein